MPLVVVAIGDPHRLCLIDPVYHLPDYRWVEACRLCHKRAIIVISLQALLYQLKDRCALYSPWPAYPVYLLCWEFYLKYTL